MNMVDQVALPLAVLLVGAAIAVAVDRAAWMRRRPGGDRGDFWTSVVLRVCFLLALPVFLSGMLAIFPKIWNTGYHAQFDLVAGTGWPVAVAYRVALLLPLAIWALLLLAGLAETPRDRDAARWLAGAIGFGHSRYWVLVWTIPIALLLMTALSNLGGGAGAFPAAAWSTLGVLLLSLIGVALSRGEITVPGTKQIATAPANTTPPPAPWPDALRARGVRLRDLASWARRPQARTVRGASAEELLDRLRARGAREIAPELIEAIDGLLTPNDSDEGRSRLIFGPDDCGQIEVVALAAELLEQRFHAATLVITAGDASALAGEFERWLPAGRKVAVVGAMGDVDADALIIVTDAQSLSDRLLPQFKNPLLVERFGLIVWWHLEAYTGVLAANLWAISRRLHRLLESMGRHDVRTLVLVRSTAHGEAQLAPFVRRLLPHPLPVHSEVPPRFPRTVHLHLLETHQDFFARGEGRMIRERYRHLPLVAARVSVEEGWRTSLENTREITNNETEAFLQIAVGSEMLRDRLAPNAAAASASIRTIESSDVLSLLEIISQGGRAADDNLPHHVGVTRPSNPYAAHLLSTLPTRNNGDGFATSRRLVSAAAQPGVVRRHLLLALEELPDTRSGLLKNFLWREEIIHKTLEEIASEGKLTRREVRFLDQNGDLQREHEYKSSRPSADERRPLDTVGATLIDVRDTAAGHDAEQGVRMRVDPERLTILAYPHRVFLHHGQRYRISDWSSAQERVAHDGFIPCTREDVCSTTWRIRNTSVFGIESADAPVGVGRSGKVLSRLTASLTYQEDVVGWLRLTPDLSTGIDPTPETHRLARVVSGSFTTRALILQVPQEHDVLALASLAQALRHLLPVHLGVEEDALEVVPLTGEFVQNRPTFGLGIVDLYPGGIGVVDAIADEHPFLLQLLEWARDWLAACPCRSDHGCTRCLRSPAALAANIDLPPMRSAALDLLRQVV